MLTHVSPELIFDGLVVSVDGPKAWDFHRSIDVGFTDVAANYRLTLHNGVLVYVKRAADPSTAAATVKLSRARLLALVGGDATSPGIEASGDRQALTQLLSVLLDPDPNFNIITP